MTYLKEGSSGSSNDSNANTEVEKVAESVCSVNILNPNVIQLDARNSKYDDNVTGGMLGDHNFSIVGSRNYLDIDVSPTVVPLTAGANVTEVVPASMSTSGTFEKNISGNSWNSWFKSTDPVVDPANEDVAVTWAVESATGTIREMAGLDVNPDQNASYSSMEYSLYQVNATTVYIYEKGANKGNYSVSMAVGDRLGIKIENGVVSYIHISSGGSVTVIAESAIKADVAMYFKAALSRGVGSSGHSQVGDVKRHAGTVTLPIGTSIFGGAGETVSEDDKRRLADVGLVVNAGVTYDFLIVNYMVSPRFPGNRQYEITHGYSVCDAQSTLSISI